MGYSVSLQCPMCTNFNVDESWEYTYNVQPMLADVGIDINSWDGQCVKDVISQLEAGIEMLKNDPQKYIAMQPANKYGSYADLLSLFLLPMLEKFLQRQNSTILVR